MDGTIKRLLSDQMIEESSERPDPALDDERRRYYRLTDFGVRVVAAKVRRMRGLVKTARARKLITAMKDAILSPRLTRIHSPTQP